MQTLSDKEIAAQLQRPHGKHAVEVGEFMAKANEKLYHELCTILKPNDNSSILEIGPGNGKFIGELVASGKGLKYTSIDLSEEMVTIATNFNSTLIEEGNVTITGGNCRKMSFEDRAFDIIIGVNTIYFWDPIETYLKELRRVLKNDGKIILVYRTRSSMMHLPFAQFGFSLYESVDVDKLLLENGFKALSSKAFQEDVKGPQGEKMRLESIFTLASSF